MIFPLYAMSPRFKCTQMIQSFMQTQTGTKLSVVIAHVTQWLHNSCLHLNIKETVCMFSSLRNQETISHHVDVAGEKRTVVSDLIYLCVIDSNLTFKTQNKMETHVVKFNFNLSNTQTKTHQVCGKRRLYNTYEEDCNTYCCFCFNALYVSIVSVFTSAQGPKMATLAHLQ